MPAILLLELRALGGPHCHLPIRDRQGYPPAVAPPQNIDMLPLGHELIALASRTGATSSIQLVIKTTQAFSQSIEFR